MVPRVRIQSSYRRRVTRAVLALFAALSVLAPAELMHFGLVQHVVCADHGELVHESASHEAHAEQENAGQRQGQGPALHAAAVAHDHEHCTFAATTREALALPPSHAVVTIGAIACSARLTGFTTDALCCEALFRLAPKTSPPA